MPLYGKALVLRQDLFAEPGPSFGAAIAAGIELRQLAGVDRVYLYLRVRDH